MFRRYFIAGLLVLLPIWATFLIIKFMVNLVDQSLSLLPKEVHPDVLFGLHIPGLGLIFTIIIVFLTGMLVTNFIGTYFLSIWENFLARIPFVRSIYTAVKQVISTMFSSGGESFRKVLLIQYPREGIWTIAFQTGTGFTFPQAKENVGDLITVFVPTTPNPTGGFLLMVPRQQVIELKMSIEQALKYIISLGVVLPPSMLEQKVRINKESI